jgi:Flp pilus assembly protein TadG
MFRFPKPRFLSRRTAEARRRGALGATIAVSSAALFGMAGLAIEGGHWLLTRRNAQNAADMAALAAARLLDGNRDAQARSAATAAAREVAARNGFAHGTAGATVTVNLDAGGNQAAVEVIVTRDITTVLTRLIPTVGNTVTPSGRAVGAAFRTQDVCILADRPDGVNRANQPTQVRYKSTDDHRYLNCVVHANAPDRGALRGDNEYGRGIVIDSINSGALVTDALRTTDSRCGKIESTATGDACGFVAGTAPFTGSVPPVSNPYAYLDALSAPACTRTLSSTSVDFAARVQGGMQVLTPGVYCPPAGQRQAAITLKEGSGTTMTPGTYYFRGVDLTIDISGTLGCVGCTFVFLDSPQAGTNTNLRGRPGSFWVKGTQLDFRAPAVNADDPALSGILFVRLSDGYLLDDQPPNSNNMEGRADGSSLDRFGVTFESAQNMYLEGGQYFSQSAVWIKSSTTSRLSPCNPIVAGNIFFDSSDDWTLDVSGCARINTPVAGIRGTRLTQ